MLAAACAGGAPPRSADRAAPEACSSATQPSVSGETVKRLEQAGNVLEYENVWREAHPGSASGTISGSEVRARIRSHTAEIQECYASALDRLPAGESRVVVRFVVDASGRVPAVSIASSDFEDQTVGCCVAKHAAQWTFPTPTNGGFVVVEYPFVVRTAKSR